MPTNSPSTSQELAVIDATVLAVRRAPKDVLAEAHDAAREIQLVVAAKPRKVMLNGEQYLEFEDWQTVGRFYGITPKVVDVRYVEYGNVVGFTADAVALRADGMEISRASADCLNDEEKWRAKPKYERELQMLDGTWVAEPVDEAKYPKSAWKWHENPRRPESRRRQVGEEKVPLFQLKSMAQTRACSKVLRNVLAWVVVLAGYRPTPAEELESVPDVRHEPQGQPQAAPPASTAGAPPAASVAPPAAAKPAGGGSTASSPAPVASGATSVKDVQIKTGANARGPWKRYLAIFADGRQGSTFSESIGIELEALKKSGALVNPILEKTDKRHDLKGFSEVVVAPEPPHVDEPVAGPEKVLTVRKLETDHGTRWMIQTDKRQLVTDQMSLADEATAARAAKLGVTPTFEVLKSASGNAVVNKLTALVVEDPDGPEESTEREPGQEG